MSKVKYLDLTAWAIVNTAGNDRQTLTLNGIQNELIQAVRKVCGMRRLERCTFWGLGVLLTVYCGSGNLTVLCLRLETS